MLQSEDRVTLKTDITKTIGIISEIYVNPITNKTIYNVLFDKNESLKR